MQTTAHEAARLPPHARRYDITGCHLAAIVLERLQYWTPRTRVQKRGKAWIVKSRADLIRETRLTDWQLRAALEKLKERELIQIEQLPFGGKNVTHIRFTPRGLIALGNSGFRLKIEDAEEPQVEDFHQPELDASHQPELDADHQLLSQGDIDKGLYTGGNCNSYGVTANPDFSEKVPEETKAMQGPRKPKVNPPKAPLAAKPAPWNSAEVMEMLKAGKPAPKPGKPVPLGEVWQSAMVEFFPGEFHPALTMKAQGQLKQAAAKLPPGEASKVIRAIISDWGHFTDKAAAEAKAFDVPLKPLPGFFLRYVAVAANFKAKAAASGEAAVATVEPPKGGWAKKGAQLNAQTPATPKAKKLSPDEALALMNELEKDG